MGAKGARSLPLADIVAKVFLGCRTKILRAAEAFCARRRKGPYRFIQNRSPTSVAALKSDAEAEKPKDHLSRVFRGRAIFDFCNKIRGKADIPPKGRDFRLGPIRLKSRKSKEAKNFANVQRRRTQPRQASVEPYERQRSLVRQSLWSLTPQHVRRTSGPENFQPSAKKDFFNTIGPKQIMAVSQNLPASVRRTARGSVGWT